MIDKEHSNKFGIPVKVETASFAVQTWQMQYKKDTDNKWYIQRRKMSALKYAIKFVLT